MQRHSFPRASRILSHKDPSPLLPQDSQRPSRDESFGVEWEEFEMGGIPSSAEQSPRKDSHEKIQMQMQQMQLEGQTQHQTNGFGPISPRDATDGKEKEKEKGAPRRRRDSWDNPMDEGKSPGIGKLKISREMREKLEALTSSHPSR